MAQKILVVDDNKNAQELLSESLTGLEFVVFTASNGRDALSQMEAVLPDLILLDVMMPTMDGYQFISRVRKTSNVPIIMLTAKRQEHDVVRGFELGADDYVTKPFRIRELLMRVRAVLRRAKVDTDEPEAKVQVIGALTIDKANRRAEIEGRTVNLTAAEFCVLERLAQSVDLPVTHASLSTHLIYHNFSGSENTLKIHVRNIRLKIEPDPTRPKFIEMVFGTGYRLLTNG
ncbi:MAG: response regulator transcription factor [Anaerolineae bacterium]